MQTAHKSLSPRLVSYVSSRPFAAVALIGSIYLAVVSWYLNGLSAEPFFGSAIYDCYYMAVLNGQFDLPPRLLRFEGHYTPEGDGYLYHGVGPLILRFGLGWVWPFDTASMSGFAIWFWAVFGTVFYQSALKDVIEDSGAQDQAGTYGWAIFFSAALWLCGPALLLVANHSLYHEPIAVAYGVTGAFLAVGVRYGQGRMRPLIALSLLALCAAVVLHARPNLAIGLYLAVVGLCLWSLAKHGMRVFGPAVLAGAILGAGGLLYLGLNTLRFGEAAEIHGSFEASDTQYGPVFWGIEQADSPRAEAFTEHGRFNVQRVLPNASLYALDLPALELTHRASAFLYNSFENATRQKLGYIRVEGPRFGFVWLWLVWVGLGVVGLFGLRRPEYAILAAGLLSAVFLTLSYGTITLRYRFDLWPFVAFIGFLGAARVMSYLTADRYSRITARILVFCFVLSLTATTMAAILYATQFREVEGSFFTAWSEEYCVFLAERAGLPNNKMTVICRAPTEIKG